MTEYIDRNALLQKIRWASDAEEAVISVRRMPAADVAPVAHGQWKTELDDLGWLTHTCTVCGYVKRTDVHVSLGWNYCPICGQKAGGGED